MHSGLNHQLCGYRMSMTEHDSNHCGKRLRILVEHRFEMRDKRVMQWLTKPCSLKPQHEEHEVLIIGVTGTGASSLCFHSLRSHCKRWCATLGSHKRDLDPPGASAQKLRPLHFRSQGTIKTKKRLFQEAWRGRRFKEKMRLQNWNQ